MWKQPCAFVDQRLNLDVANVLVFLAGNSLLLSRWAMDAILSCQFGCIAIPQDSAADRHQGQEFGAGKAHFRSTNFVAVQKVRKQKHQNGL